jgi:hypothetical protein
MLILEYERRRALVETRNSDEPSQNDDYDDQLRCVDGVDR